MSVPKKRKPSSSVKHGRSHLALKKTTLNKCPKCGHTILPHTACSFCGFYKGKEAIKIKNKAKK